MSLLHLVLRESYKIVHQNSDRIRISADLVGALLDNMEISNDESRMRNFAYGI